MNMPDAYEAEMYLLGAILTDARAFEKVEQMVRPEHFTRPENAGLYRACSQAINRTGKALPVTLAPLMNTDRTFEHVGGAAYLEQIAGRYLGLWFEAENYGRQVVDAYERRELIAGCRDAIDQASVFDIETTAGEIRETLEGRLFAITDRPGARGGFVEWTDSLDRALATADAAHKAQGKVLGIPSGLDDLDRKIGGFVGQRLYILAGRPGMGKTALAVSAAVGAARAGKRVGIFSLEMGDDQLAGRVLYAHAGLGIEDVMLGRTRPEDMTSLAHARADLSRLPLTVDPSSALTVAAMRTRARRLKQRKGLDMIVVDYIGLADPGVKLGSKVHEIEAITNGLKNLAKDLDVPVLALSQLSRAVEAREDKRPMLSDLRDSGAIEQDADVVMFVYRDAYYAQADEPKRKAGERDDAYQRRYDDWQHRIRDNENVAEIIVAKNRHGSTGNVRVYFDAARTQFGNLARAA